MMIDDFSTITTNLTKDEWRTMLKKFVPTFDWKNGNGNGKHSGNGKYLSEIKLSPVNVSVAYHKQKPSHLLLEYDNKCNNPHPDNLAKKCAH